MNSTTTVQGMTLDVQTIEARGAKQKTEVKMMGNTVQKIVFDGKAGYMEAQGQKVPMPEAEATKMAKDTEIFPELTMAKSGEFKVAGIEKFNGEDSYVVKSNDETHYYSVKTGLKTGESKIEKGQAVPVTYSDYKDVSGVKLPYKFTQSAMGMDMEFTVKSYTVNQATDADFK